MSREDLMNVWRNRECHRISKLEELTYNPRTGHLAFFFEGEWEGYFSDYRFALLLSDDKIDYGIDQSYWNFCEDDAGEWFEQNSDEQPQSDAPKETRRSRG
jgi:hypothetical protein